MTQQALLGKTLTLQLHTQLSILLLRGVLLAVAVFITAVGAVQGAQ
jgi:hypothetical protein